MLGVVGGMGPLATADFLAKLVAARSAGRDQDHVPVIVWGDTRIPDRTAALIDGGADPLPGLTHATAKLIALGAEAVVIPCNTAHYWAVALAGALCGRPLLHIVDAVLAQTPGVARLGVLATSGTIAARVYQDALARHGIEAVFPDAQGQARTMAAVTAVKAGDVGQGRKLAEPILDDLLARADRAVLACTELPLALPHRVGDDVIDATAALAADAVRWWTMKDSTNEQHQDRHLAAGRA